MTQILEEKQFKLAEHNKGTANDFKIAFGTIVAHPKSSYLTISGYHQMNDTNGDYERNIRRLVAQMKVFNNWAIPGVFGDLALPGRFVSIFESTSSAITKSTYFCIEMDMFFIDEISTREPGMKSKHQVYLELLADFLSENRYFRFESKKFLN